ncbi:MAG: glycoside hydrolase family 71/99 protein [Eubacteriales bacterium]
MDNIKQFEVYEATDDLGRTLPTERDTGKKRVGRYVGMFYFLWCGEHSIDYRPLDITKLLSADSESGYKPDSDVWGKYSVMHHWGEPLYGYYYSDDEWVMRRHIEMLTIADVDFLVFDTTNAVTYTEKAKTMMRLLSEYRASGWNTPKVVFYTNTASGKTAQKIYDEIYKTDYCSDSWFYVDGKPIIIAVADECSPNVREFFTIRASQWPNEATKLGGWPWMDFVRPQRVLKNLRGEDEIINVSVAQHPQIRFGDSAMYGEESNCGRSYHNGANDKSEGAYKYGYNFIEQWERALETDPPYVFVTGWNEWIAGRWQGTPERPLLFVDCCDLEYSRDIEPMKGGYFDNYYLQLISYIRRYKGTSPCVTAKLGETINYRDFPCGAFNRSNKGYSTYYKDESGRNEIIGATVTDNGDNLVFTAETASPIEKYDFHSNWMNLFIDVDGSSQPSFYGYNYLLNTYQFTDTTTCIARCTENSRTIESDTFKLFSLIEFNYNKNKISLTVPKNLLNLPDTNVYKLRFKWLDSKSEVTRMEDFYTKGDAAPIGRLNFVFIRE